MPPIGQGRHVAPFGDGRDWIFEKRFGLFVHWGLYAIPAWHEQIVWRKGVNPAEYEKLIHEFNPVKFDPDAWLDLAEEAGMEYVCFTTKHHDGFCLWDTAETEYKIANTPYGEDILRKLADACHRRDFPLCLYYSVADWHQPNYPNQGRSHELPGPKPGDEPDVDKYFDFLRRQVRELCTQYGEVHGVWWDMNVADMQGTVVNEMIRELQPKAVINDRGFGDGDFGTPEREHSRSAEDAVVFDRLTEACQAVGYDSWGYRAEEDYYADAYLIRAIDSALAKGGRYLLNVGPMADGTIDPESARILRAIGAWYGRVREAFGDAAAATLLVDSRDALLTRRGDTLYVHLNTPPVCSRIMLKPIDRAPQRATLLNTGEAVETRVEYVPRMYPDTTPYLRLRKLPVNEAPDTALVIRLDFEPGYLDTLEKA